MHRFLYFLLVILFACNAKHDLADADNAQKESAALREKLMVEEANVTSNFIQLRDFHLALMQETTRTDHKSYTSLDSLFYELKTKANLVIEDRMDFDSAQYVMDRLPAYSSREERRKKEDAGEKQEYSRTTQLRHVAEYSDERKQYEMITTAYAIRRVMMSEYAVELNVRVIHWQDSLEEVGRIIAREKAELRRNFPEQKGEAFFAAYKPVSELELKMKLFDAMLIQLQNSLSRFEEGNSEEYFYFGPYIRPRAELQATESILGELSIMMNDCRQADRLFRQR